MTFVSERNIAIGNALERAKFEIINAQEAMDDKTLLWHIYKAQKGLKEAAALLVERQSIERGKAAAIDRAKQAVGSCEQHKNSTDKLLEGLSSEQKAIVLTDIIIRTLRGETDK